MPNMPSGQTDISLDGYVTAGILSDPLPNTLVPQEQVCPCCGRCPTCGHTPYQPAQAPYVPPNYGPYWTRLPWPQPHLYHWEYQITC